MILQSIGYANLAKLDPQYGLCKYHNPLNDAEQFSFARDEHAMLLSLILFLCVFFLKDTSVVPPLIYAVMGTSREIAIGPVAVVSLLLSSMIQNVVDPAADPAAYRSLVFTVTFLAGVFQVSFGLFRSAQFIKTSTCKYTPLRCLLPCWEVLYTHVVFNHVGSWRPRLGFLVDFLSHAAIVGFMAGAAIVIGMQQLKGLLGLSHFTNSTDIVSVIKAVCSALHDDPVSDLSPCPSWRQGKHWLYRAGACALPLPSPPHKATTTDTPISHGHYLE